MWAIIHSFSLVLIHNIFFKIVKREVNFILEKELDDELDDVISYFILFCAFYCFVTRILIF